jgi:hypothetical protein
MTQTLYAHMNKKKSVWRLVPVGGCKERVQEGEGNGNIMYSCIKM